MTDKRPKEGYDSTTTAEALERLRSDLIANDQVLKEAIEELQEEVSELRRSGADA